MNRTKKQYVSPAVEVVNIQTQGTLLAVSGEEGTQVKTLRSYGPRQDMEEWN